MKDIKRVEFEPDGSKGPPKVTPCCLCCLKKNSCGEACEEYYYEFSEEPEKIKAEPLSEYEHNLERWKLLDNWHHPKYTAEYKKLEKWIKANKPEKWETVTIENTKIGDVVRFTTSKNIRRVKYISDNIDLIIVDGQGVDDVQERIGRYEINTYKE